ncbi:GntR family transcriptional regulator [Elongatibacter sediminis]|uniref:GntR family transcriptional regulator n=1 Tax=Elongatibacter sediminis TaxID=3119006 RepID=A0AAW9RFN1_9GAMM
MAGLEKKTITTLVLEQIREMILSQKLKPGEPLRQVAIGEELNVSRIPVREALLQLEAEGLVKFTPHKGAVVTEVEPDQVEEIFDLRETLESRIFSLAFPRITTEDLEEAQGVLDRFETLLQPGADISEWSKLNWEFHEALYRPAHRKRTLQFIKMLHADCDRYLRMQISLSGSYEDADREHRQLLKLCKAGKKREAVQLLKSHIRKTGSDLVQALDRAD